MTKHIQIRKFYTSQLITSGRLGTLYVSSSVNAADVMTEGCSGIVQTATSGLLRASSNEDHETTQDTTLDILTANKLRRTGQHYIGASTRMKHCLYFGICTTRQLYTGRDRIQHHRSTKGTASHRGRTSVHLVTCVHST